MLCVDFVALTAAYNWEPYLARLPVTATQDDLAADDMSVGLGPTSGVVADGRRSCGLPRPAESLRQAGCWRTVECATVAIADSSSEGLRRGLMRDFRELQHQPFFFL
jgi:hypothetical protein